jgi:hypothetical protein
MNTSATTLLHTIAYMRGVKSLAAARGEEKLVSDQL